MRHWRLFAIASFVACNLPGDAEAACKIEHVLDLPVVLGSNGPMVDATKDGATLHFLVVSEAPVSQIASSTVDLLGLKLGSQAPGDDMRDDSGKPLANMVAISNLRVGQSILPPVTFIVTPIIHGVDGYIGYELLGLVDTEYNLAGSSIRLSKPTSCSPGELAYWSTHGNVSVADMAPDAYPYVADLAVRVNGLNMVARISTNTLHNVLYRASATRAGIAAKLHIDNVLTVKSLSIGSEVIKDSTVEISDSKSDIDMLLGLDFLRSHRVIISRVDKKLYFTRVGKI